ncbi:MAG: type II secretion system F family protein [Candidatus Omnitrophica bacterium]|nr:type II secretion system F family protein [Candidatus Omnitrophota bacterium]
MKIEVLNRLGKIRTLEVEDKSEIETLKKQGFFILSRKKTFSFKRSSTLKPVHLAELFRDIAGLLDVGISLTEAIKELSLSTNKTLSRMLEEIHIKLSQGFFFYEALAQIGGFPQEVRASVKSGEKGAVLPDTLKRLADFYNKKAKFNTKLKMALIYPVFVISAIFIVATAVSVFVIPKMMSFYSKIPHLSGLTKGLLLMAGILAHYWWLFPCILLGLTFALRFLVSTETGVKILEKFSTVKAYLPIKERVFANFFSSLSMLVKNGVPLIEAIEMVEIQSGIFKRTFQNVKEKMTQGFSFSEALRQERIFPVFIVQSIVKGEKGASLYEYIDRIAQYYIEKTDRNYEMFLTIIEPVLISLVAVFVVFFVFAFLMPIYSNLSNIQIFGGY